MDKPLFHLPSGVPFYRKLMNKKNVVILLVESGVIAMIYSNDKFYSYPAQSKITNTSKSVLENGAMQASVVLI